MRAVIERFQDLLVGSAENDDQDEYVATARTMSLWEIVCRFWPDARPYRYWLLPLLAFVILGAALDAASIWLYKVLVDDVLVPQHFALLPIVAIAYLGFSLLNGLISFGDEVVSDWIGERFLLGLRTRLLAHLQQLPPGYFALKRRGDLVTRLTGDVAEIESLLLSGVVDLLSYLFRIVFFVAALLYLSWQLALLAFAVAPLFWLASHLFADWIKRIAREQRRQSGVIGAIAEESLAMLPLIQAYSHEQIEIDRFYREGMRNLRAQMRLSALRGLFSPLLELFELAGLLVVIGAGAWLMAQGSLTLGGLLVFATYLSQLYAPVQDLSQLATSVSAAAAGAERIIEVLDEPPAVRDATDAVTLPSAHGIVTFDAVSFRYPDGQGEALHDVSFQVAPGQMLAIVGPSGAGKSTVVRLFLRFYDPASGQIKIDGHDIRDVSLRSLRDSVAVVLQESLIVSGTVGENIAYGRSGASDSEIVQAAREADAHAFIQSLPQGYNTRLGQSGASLSGGQRQRLAIARALVRDAPILVLDEPMTGLDAATSERVLAPLRRAARGRATIVVSHNLLTVREATEIIVLEAGRIVERGTHTALLERNGAYARLYRLHHPDHIPSSEERPLVHVA